MQQNLIIRLSDKAATLEWVGGKGASLARLAGAGMPVPDGFHVTTHAYRWFIAANDLQSGINAAIQEINPSAAGSLETASSQISQLFAAAHIPGDLAKETRAAYHALSQKLSMDGEDVPVAVRSSATAEDLPEASFAGQQETYLNVRGADQVLEAVKKCWASLWTTRAIAYRARQNVPAEGVAIAVVVQLMVPAEAAGIAFTANPVNGKRDCVVINAAWGLGEAVVSGAVTPDTITVSKTAERVIQRVISEKDAMTVRTAMGTTEQAVPEALRRQPVLNDSQAVELARICLEIENLYGTPMDIEWAWSGTFSILQARPVTALPEEQAEVPTEWALPDPKAMYARSSLAEHLPNPVTPLFGTLGLQAANDSMGVLGVEIIGGAMESYRYHLINGYMYMSIVLGLKDIWLYTKATVGSLGLILGKGTIRWKEERQALREVIGKWERKGVESLAACELLEGASEILAHSARFYTILQSGTLPTATTSEMVFGRVYKSLVRRDGDPEATTFLFGFDTAPALAEKSLYDLAMWAKQRPTLAEHILHTPVVDLAIALRQKDKPAGISEEDWTGWLERFSGHLDDYGFMIYDYDFANPTPAESPESLLEAIRAYLIGKARNPYERQQEAAERREQATQKILDRLGWPRKGWFIKALKWAQDTVPLREDSLAEMGMGHPQVRRMINELARRFVAAGALACQDDIYWLEESEVREAVDCLERDESLPDYGDRIPPRKALWRAQLKATPPAVLPETSRLVKILPWSPKELEGGLVLKGTGTSAGVVTAPACVMFAPDDFDKMRPGDVLVAVTTTPAWTPLFALASAVVTDIGGPLSHSSIVAREYGIPAVMAAGFATRRIQDGQLITVDGSAGTVTMSNGAK